MNEWVALEHYHRPSTLAEAVALRQEPGAEYICGGSRLAADRPDGVTSLISVASLVHGMIVRTDDNTLLPAGLTLQQLIDGLSSGRGKPLADAAQASCSSRNLRNQRTLGGELADGRFDSDLKVALAALNPLLTVFDGDRQSIPYADWEGHGIVERASVPVARLKTLTSQRFSLLPVSPAFLVVCSCKIDDETRVAVGGAMDQIVSGIVEADSTEFIDTVAAGFRDDHFGSPEYKRHLLHVAFTRMGVMR